MEILAPVGNMEILEAAIIGGADAVYLGGKEFNARSSSTNFTLEEIAEATEKLHRLNKKIYVTCNIILFEDELEKCISFIDSLYIIGVDAVIIQDLGLLKSIYQRYEHFNIHISTQMSICDVSQIKILEKYNVKRVVLARETSLETLKEIRKNTTMEIEVFVHGALCVSYSGQCYMSSVIGKRSGNRGKCAQPCRLNYSLYENNEKIIDKKYVLSTKDLCTIDNLDLILPYVNSLKIEGRSKSSKYVYSVVKNYKNKVLKKDYDYEQLEKIFCRKFTKGFILNSQRNEIINREYKSHFGKLIGKVVDVRKDVIRIKLENSLRCNDSIRFHNSADFYFTVNKMSMDDKLIVYGNQGDVVDLKWTDHEAKLNDLVYKLVDFDEFKKLDEEMKNRSNFEKIKINLEIYILHKKLYFKMTEKDFFYEESVDINYEINPLKQERIVEQLLKFGNTNYSIDKVKIDISEKVGLKISDLNHLRRSVVENFNLLKIKKEKNAIILSSNENHIENEKIYNDQVFIIVENENQYQIAKKFTDNIICNFEEEAIYLEKRILDNVKKNKMFISNIGSVHKRELTISSPYFNCVNNQTVRFLKENNVDLICLSYELSYEKLKKMNLEKDNNLIFPIYGKIDLMYLKSCLVKSDLLNCGESCKNKDYYLIDRLNYKFPLIIKDCNTRILNSKVLYLVADMKRIKECNVTNFLVTFTTETDEEVENVLNNIFNDENNAIDNKTFGSFNDSIE